MAFVQESGVVRRFIGLSTDTKPTGLNGVGHRLKELDTGQRYIWNGVGWVEDMEIYNAVKLALQD